MHFCGPIVAISLGLLAPATATAQSESKASTRSAVSIEIERILMADNVDVSSLSSRGVADAIAQVARGDAPHDFWRAYRAHVLAWQRLADIEERAQSVPPGFAAMANFAAELDQANREVEASFQKVTRIAEEHGARLPVAAAELAQTS